MKEKRMKKSYISIVASLFLINNLLFLYSCDNGKTADQKMLFERKSLQEKSIKKLSECVKIKRIIPLETNETCLVGDIRGIRKFGSSYYICSQTGPILCFNEKGEFKGKIGDVGKAKNEYISAMGVDFYKDRIYVQDFHKIVVYDLFGQYLQSIPVSYNAQALKVLDSGNLLLFVLGEDHVLHLINNEGKTLKSAVEKNEALRLVRSQPFYLYKGKILFQEGMSNGLHTYDVQKDEFGEALIMEGGNILTMERQKEIEESGNLEEKEQYQLFSLLSINDSQFMFASIEKDNIKVYVQDLETMRTIAFPLRDVENDLTFVDVTNFFCDNTYAPDCFITCVDVPLLRESMKKTSARYQQTPQYQKWQQLLDSCQEQGNPVLIEYLMDMKE